MDIILDSSSNSPGRCIRGTIRDSPCLAVNKHCGNSADQSFPENRSWETSSNFRDTYLPAIFRICRPLISTHFPSSSPPSISRSGSEKLWRNSGREIFVETRLYIFDYWNISKSGYFQLAKLVHIYMYPTNDKKCINREKGRQRERERE